MELGKFVKEKMNKMKKNKANKLFIEKTINFVSKFDFSNPQEGFEVIFKTPTVTEDLSNPMVDVVSGVKKPDEEHKWFLSEEKSLKFNTKNYTFDAEKYESGISIIIFKGNDKICVIGQNNDTVGKSHLSFEILKESEMKQVVEELTEKIEQPTLKKKNKNKLKM